ncbi:putative porin [Prevotella sp. A2931]|uniref:Porin n=1 Tax=Prevotella illustrans TaxID=2800387 RepID=A0ABS3M8A5_9BACT|nr:MULTISPECIES: putative porin [Prevotella]MBO1364414.1 putative porin [Prevotella illustrans]PTL25135.1 hypothetical protein C3V39_10490 [Prevotella sp. oral taxon 820]
MKTIASILTLLFVVLPLQAQIDDSQYNQMDPSGNISRRNSNKTDSLGSDKEIPKGIKVWTIDKRFGERKAALPDTISHMFMNSIFTSELRGEYNTTGNLGSPRLNRIFIDRNSENQFLFVNPLDFFVTPVDEFHFTNTLSPITNLTYDNSGDKTNGDDHFIAKFGVNAGKRIGVGFKFDYLYARGYYQNQSTSHFNYSLYGSYIGDRYQAHLLFSTNHQKIAENGGLANDDYITHPESFSDSYSTNEIPTILQRNWNRNDNLHFFFNHKYSIGFNRKVPMTADEIKAKKFAMASAEENKRKNENSATDTERGKGKKAEKRAMGRPEDASIAGIDPPINTGKDERIQLTKSAADSLLSVQNKESKDTSWIKNEFVPVTSFIHTFNFDNYRRIYEAYQTPENFYANTYKVEEKLSGDSIYDKTTHYHLSNVFAISLLEGFNKWAKAGLKGFVTWDLKHFNLPDSVGISSYTENGINIGGQLCKAQGKFLHYLATVEATVAGPNSGDLKIDANADINFSLFGDTLSLIGDAFIHRVKPAFYFRHYHGRHFWWDNDNMERITHTRIQGVLSYTKTRTKLRIAVDNINNYTYLAQSYLTEGERHTKTDVTVRQGSKPINLFTAQLIQDFKIGPFNWENVITYQKTSDQSQLPVPDLNLYSNLYLRFKIAKVLNCDFGADVRYFTNYYAPDYSPALGQFAVQTNSATDNGADTRIKIGNYPLVNVYANFHLKHTRFFVMYSHVNAGMGDKRYFSTPHYALNERIFRLGLSWNFFN